MKSLLLQQRHKNKYKVKNYTTMQNKVSKIQQAILIGFNTFYFIVLAVNAVKAAAGLERLAVHHWPLFAVTALIGWASLERTAKSRIIITAKRTARASKRVVEKAARTLLCVSRAVGCLPALFVKSYKEFREA